MSLAVGKRVRVVKGGRYLNMVGTITNEDDDPSDNYNWWVQSDPGVFDDGYGDVPFMEDELRVIEDGKSS